MEFELPTDEECEIKIVKEGQLLGTVDCLDIVVMREKSVEEAKKLGVDDFWDIMLDKLESRYNLGIKHKATALALYSEANDMLVNIKKKSSPLLRQFDSMVSQMDGESES